MRSRSQSVMGNGRGHLEANDSSPYGSTAVPVWSNLGFWVSGDSRVQWSVGFDEKPLLI
jgi:hypothetical protein